MLRLILRRPLLLSMAMLACFTKARADGLIYQLPADGAWVEYALSEKGNFAFPTEHEQPGAQGEAAGLSFKSSGSLRLSSVGRLVADEEPCRWIELQFSVKMEQTKAEADGKLPALPPESRRMVLKLLIPEKHLKAGTDRSRTFADCI